MPSTTKKYYQKFNNNNNNNNSNNSSTSTNTNTYANNIFYDQKQLKLQRETVNLTIFGNNKNIPYIDPLTERTRRVPLEVLREWENRSRFICTGSAENTDIFTTAKPVLSYATVGVINVYL